MNENNTIAKQKSKLPLPAVLGLVAAIALILLLIINSAMCSSAKSSLVGKTYSGTYSYNGTYSFNNSTAFTIRDSYKVEFIDENTCTITVHYKTKNEVTKDNSGAVKNRDETVVYENVSYDVSGGLGGLKLTWDKNSEHTSQGLCKGQEPFEISVSGEGKPLLRCKEFMSGESLLLYGNNN